MRTRFLYLASFLLIVFGTALTRAQNFVVIGSEQAPIKYIRGAGSNIGLIVGVEYKPEGAALGKTTRGEIGVGRSFRGGANKGGGQGFGKPRASIPNASEGHSSTFPLHQGTFNSSSLNLRQRPAHVSRFFSDDAPRFQLKPASDYMIESEKVTEILLPVLCQDLYLDVPDPTPDPNFQTFPLSDTVAQAYVGIYRMDKYLNQNVISKVLFDGQFLAYDPSLVSPFELQMILNCHIEVDSSSLGRIIPEYYNIRHAHLSPGLANFPIWAARHNQDQAACEAGINYLRSRAGEPPASLEEVQDIFYLNHIVFLMGEMTVFKDRFPSPGGPVPQVPNLEPYAYIQWNPNRHEAQNSANGVIFSGQHSFDPDGEINSYRWDFGNGDTSQEKNPAYKFRANGNYKVVLTVQDDLSTVSRDTVLVAITRVGLNDRESNLPKEFLLQQNSPNPFSAATAITFESLRSEMVKIQIYDLAGREVVLLANARMEPGRHQIFWNGKDQHGKEAPSGLYFYRLTTPLFSQVKRMVLLR